MFCEGERLWFLPWVFSIFLIVESPGVRRVPAQPSTTKYTCYNTTNTNDGHGNHNDYAQHDRGETSPKTSVVGRALGTHCLHLLKITTSLVVALRQLTEHGVVIFSGPLTTERHVEGAMFGEIEDVAVARNRVEVQVDA
jgi:hypothetical protein